MSDIPKNRQKVSVDVAAFLSRWASIMNDSANNDGNADRREIARTNEAEFRKALKQAESDADELEALRAALWQCFTDAGGDTDGKADAAGISTDDLISTTTDCVKDLRLGYDEMLDESSEADRLRARVAELEAARGEPVAWMNPYGGTLQVRITGLEYEKYTIPLYTAPPAPTVDVDAISDEALNAAWSYIIFNAENEQTEAVYDMRAALRAIFNKGE